MDDVQLIQIISFDVNKNKIIGTVLYPTFEEQGKTTLHFLQTESNSFHQILPRLNTKSNLPIETGQLNMVLLGTAYAKKGVQPLVDSIARDPRMASRIQLGVAEGNGWEILKRSKGLNVPFHISGKVEQNINNGDLPEMNLHIFLFDYYGEGRDPFLPYFHTKKGELKSMA